MRSETSAYSLVPLSRRQGEGKIKEKETRMWTVEGISKMLKGRTIHISPGPLVLFERGRWWHVLLHLGCSSSLQLALLISLSCTLALDVAQPKVPVPSCHSLLYTVKHREASTTKYEFPAFQHQFHIFSCRLRLRCYSSPSFTSSQLKHKRATSFARWLCRMFPSSEQRAFLCHFEVRLCHVTWFGHCSIRGHQREVFTELAWCGLASCALASLEEEGTLRGHWSQNEQTWTSAAAWAQVGLEGEITQVHKRASGSERDVLYLDCGVGFTHISISPNSHLTVEVFV